MNFDKNHVASKKSIPTGTRIFRRISLTALKIFLVLLLFCVILGTAAGVGMIKGLIASAPNIDSLSVAPADRPPTSITPAINRSRSLPNQLPTVFL